MAKVKQSCVYISRIFRWDFRPNWGPLVTLAKRFRCRFDPANRQWNIRDQHDARMIAVALLEQGEPADAIKCFGWVNNEPVEVRRFISEEYATSQEPPSPYSLPATVTLDGAEVYISMPLDKKGKPGPDYALYYGLATIGCDGEFVDGKGFRLRTNAQYAIEYMVADGKFPIVGVPKIPEQPIILDMFDKGTVMPHQDVGTTFLYSRKSALLADDMGLGKSLQSILAADQCRLDGEAEALIIVCPVSLIGNWQNELAKWESSFSEVMIIPYSRFKLLAEVHRYHKGAIVIVDEAHYLKNPSSQRTKTFSMFTKDCKVIKRLWFLTGTPVTKGFGDLWPMAHMMNHPLADKYGPSRLDGLNDQEIVQITGAMRTHMLMRKKTEVLDLPPKMRQVRTIDTNLQSVQNEYLKILAHGRQALALEHLMRLKRFTAEAKVEHTIELARGVLAEGRKVVVFSDHLDAMEAIRSALDPFGTVVLNGATRDRQSVVDRFQSDPKSRVFLGQIKAAGVGITLTAAQDVIFNDFDWLPSNMHQAEDRCHRIGTTGTVSIYYLADCKLILDELLMNRLAERSAEIATFEQSTQTLLKEVAEWAQGQLAESAEAM